MRIVIEYIAPRIGGRTSVLLPVLWLISLFVFAQTLPAARIPIGGRLVDEELRPVGGARLTLHPIVTPYEDGILWLEGLEEPEAVATARSDHDGRYRLEAPSDGMWLLVISERGDHRLHYELAPLLEPRELPDLIVPAALSRTIRAFDVDGTPVSGTWVKVEPVESFRPPRRPRSYIPGAVRLRSAIRTLRADEQGVVRLVMAGESFRARAYAQGYAESADVEGEGSSITLSLVTGREEEITARFGTGVTPRAPAPDVLLRTGEGRWPVGVTDASGRCSVTLPIDGPRAVLAEGRDGRRGELEALASPETASSLIVELRRPETVVGTILDAATRQPIQGAYVWSGHPSLHVRSGNRGDFEVEIGQGPRPFLTAAASGFSTEGAATDPLGGRGAERVIVRLQPTASLSGRVVDETGRAIADAMLRGEIDPRVSRVSSYRVQIRSGDDGSFRLAPMALLSSYRLRASLPGYAATTVEVSRPEDALQVSGIEVVMVPGRIARGLVVDIGDQPIEGVQIRLESAPPSDTMRRWAGSVYSSNAIGPASSATDEHGRFEVHDLSPGRFNLTATRQGYAETTVPGVEVPEGQGAFELGTVVLDAGVAIGGTVRNRDGEPIAGAEVYAQPQSTRILRAMGEEELPVVLSELDGHFHIEDLRPGDSVSLSVAASGYGLSTLPSVEAPRQDVEVILDPVAKISGLVVDSDGSPIAKAWVTVHPETRTMLASLVRNRLGVERAETDASGTFELAEVDAGRVRLSAFAAGFSEPEPLMVTVEAGTAVQDVRIVLPRGAEISGRVVGPNGEPLSNAMVTLVNHSSGGGASRTGTDTDSAGRYRISSPFTGTITVVVSHAEYQHIEREVEVPPGTATVDFRLEAGWDVAGSVFDADGRPILGATVALGGFMFVRKTVTADDGSFSLSGVADGSHPLAIEKSGFASYSRPEPVDIEGGSVLDLRIVLETGARVLGRVLGLEFDELAEVEIFAQSANSASVYGNVDYEGSFRLENLVAGEWEIFAILSDGARRTSARLRIDHPAGDYEVELEFASGFSLSGRILRGEVPMTGAGVGADGADVEGSSYTTTDDQGTFRLHDLQPGRYKVIVIPPRGRFAHRRDVEIYSDREITIGLDLYEILGSVIDADTSMPIQDADVHVESTSAATGYPSTATEVTDPSGRFKIPELPAGPYRIRVQKPGYGAVTEDVTIAEGGPALELTLALHPAAGLALEVLLPSGRPVTRVIVIASDSQDNVVFYDAIGSRGNGRIEVSSLPPGRWQLSVRSQQEEFATAAIPVIVPRETDEPLPVQLLPPVPLTVIVPDLADQGQFGSVSVRDAGGHLHLPFAGSLSTSPSYPLRAGRAIIRILHAGTWRIEAATPDGRRWSGIATIQAGQPATVMLE